MKINEKEFYTIWRRRNRVRLIDVSNYCHCSISLISMWENGVQGMSNVILRRYDDYIDKYNKGLIKTQNQ